MFSKLKDKLKDWTKKIIEDKEEEVIEIKEEKKSKKNKDNKKNKKKDKKIKSVNTKNTKKESKEKIKKQLEEKLEQIQEEIEIKKSEEKQEEKKGFFQKLFSKENAEETPTEKIEEEIKEIPKNKNIEEKIQIPENKKLQTEKEPTKEKEQQTEKKEEKKSFFKKILTGTIKTSEEEKPIETEKIEEIKEEPIKEKKPVEEKVEETIQETQKKKSFFEKILTGTIKISEEEFNNYSEELEMLLLENNVAFEVTEKVLEELKEKLVGKEIPKKELEQEIKNNLKEILKEILIEPFNIVEKIKEKSKRGEPYVILFCGINGTGKTTTIAKIAHMLKQEKLSCVIAAADTFRAAAIDQIKTHGERLDTKVIAHEYGSDPASVGYDAIKYAKKNNIPCVLIDTAGRIHTATNLLREMEKIVKVCKPDTKIFVGESITGNDAIEQVKSFNDIIGIDGIILSKADIDEKGGTALSLGYTTKKPILYLGIGQEYNQIELFDKNKFLEKLGL